jgi:hypothetical protein
MQFIPNTEIYSPPPTAPAPQKSTREPVRVILVGAEVNIEIWLLKYCTSLVLLNRVLGASHKLIPSAASRCGF